MAGDPDPPEARVDARALLADDVEPLDAILAALAGLPPGGRLVVDAPFRPVPLEAVLTGRGCAVTVEPIADGHWRLEAVTPEGTG